MAEHRMIETPEALEALVAELRSEPVIAVDTEADSFFHYFDKICLLQIGTSKDSYLVDPLSLPEGGLAVLGPVLADPRVRKVFHAAEYDMYVLQRYGGLKVKSLFDTMVSAQLLGYPSVGLAALVEHHFDVQLSKDQQRTDWSRRPLRDAQLSYAASDVAYLLELSNRLEKELEGKGRLEWAQHEFRAIEDRTWPEREFDPDGYLRIKGARKLTPRQLAVIRELYLMRDKRARDIDRPPFKVLGNRTLLDLAQRPPSSRRALAGRKGVTDLVVRRLGPAILDAVQRGLEGPERAMPERKVATGRKRLDRRGEQRLDWLKRWRARKSAEVDLDPGVFCPNTALEEIACAAPEKVSALAKLTQVKKWWAKAFGEELIATIAEFETANATAREAEKADPSGDPATPPSRSRNGRRRGRRRKRTP